MSKTIILIGGMPTAGKSTIAQVLSDKLHLPWISTDQIGTMMRAVANREEYPTLFTWEDYNGFEYLSKFTADEIADNEFALSDALWLGVRKFIKEDFAWKDGFIIEGDVILPRLVAQDFSNASNVKAVFIGDLDSQRVRSVVLTRNFAGNDAITYSDAVKEKEVEWILNYGKKLKSQVLGYKMPWVEVAKNSEDIVKVLEALNL